ncbi:MAG: type I DNA topoisomerase [Cytophagales bacterium]|nr:MAG: type I DNA topoisomerase [Cytophagales bacterium]TAF59893.1 MAG: type I DNA topoisomerase [Cytophagales bacterium]
MSKNLLIVESPAKAKTIGGYLGPDFIVKSSFGHVRDLPKGNKAIDLENGFMPHYEVMSDKKEIVSELKELASKAECVWLATDEDREGEAISWHLREALGLKPEKTRRIVFHEITKNAILKAVSNPRKLDLDLVNAQQARRVLDRLVGFELSPVLWSKIRKGLSAGRVQSAAVRIIVDREREIEKFASVSFYRVIARFPLENNRSLLAELPRKLNNGDEVKAFLNKCIGAAFSIKSLDKKPAKKTPSAPFTTSTLQQEASRKLGFSVSRTMRLAQDLYEAGHITYMRTDSTTLSEEALQKAASEINKLFGSQYLHTRRYKTKSESAQEAHEAIRPTNFAVQKAGKDEASQKLYDLIWRRTLASQMAEAQLERTIATVAISTVQDVLTATGEVIIFDGFLKLYTDSSDDEDDEESSGMLPPLALNQKLTLGQMVGTERFTKPKPRYTEAALVKAMEEMGIGRPSTYAPTISTIQKREYVVKESREGKTRTYQEYSLSQNQITSAQKTENSGADKNKLFPTDIGGVVNDFLFKHFPNIIDFSFTAKVEKQFDEIASGKIVWNHMIADFYKDFHPTVENTKETAELASASTARTLGEDPKTGRPVIAKLGRYGAYVEIPSGQEDVKPQYASLKHGQSLSSITLVEALDLFKLPREVGSFEGKIMKVNVGRFGPYIQHDSKFVSVPKGIDLLSITEQESIQLILDKRDTEAKKTIKSFDENPDVKVLNGRYGPYIAIGKANIKIPKGLEASELTLADCLRLAEEAPPAKSNWRGGAKTNLPPASKAKTTAKKAQEPVKASTKPKAVTKKASTAIKPAATATPKKVTTRTKK